MSVDAPFNTISVVGLGYVGLPTAATIASRGVNVIGVDINAGAVRTINNGTSHLEEPDLDVVLQGAIATGQLRAVTNPEPAEVFVITVPTPIGPHKRADLSHVEAVVRSIAPILEPGNMVILESTSPVGTTLRMTQIMAELRTDLSFPHQAPDQSDIMVAYCPERILPGHTLRELVDNSRTVGGLDARSGVHAASFYRIFCTGEITVTSSSTAEFVKLAENAYRDVNLAFANELSMVCSDLDLDVETVIAAANLHPRVNVLQPGPGVGGHCIPIDPWFIVEAAPNRARIIKTAREVNEAKTDYVFEQIRSRLDGNDKKTIAFLGLAYKADVGDMRESPALKIVQRVCAQKPGKFLVAEPHIDELPDSLKILGNIELVNTDAAIERSDLVVLLVAHQAFSDLDTERVITKELIDTVGLWKNTYDS